jgi:hypothetical protein
MDEKLTIFIAVTSAAVVLQMLILAGMFFTMRKLATQVLGIADEFKTKALPLLDDTKHLQADVKKILETSTPKVELVLDNAAAITTSAHSAIGRVEATLNDVLDRARLQTIRADELITRAMDHVEETSDKVTHAVSTPVRQASGILQGISTGVGTYFGNKKARKAGPSDEMFI